MLEMDLKLPQIGDLDSDTDDNDVELFLPGTRTEVPEAAIEALLAREASSNALLGMIQGASEHLACNQLPNTLKASPISPPVQADTKTVHTSTDVNHHPVADQRVAGQTILEGCFNSSSSSTELFAREVYQAEQLVHAELAAEHIGCNNSNSTDMHKTAETSSSSAAAAAGAKAKSHAAAATAVENSCCEPLSSGEQATAAPVASSSSWHKVAGVCSSSGGSQQVAGAAHHNSTRGSCPARPVVLSADGMLDDLDLDDLLLRLSLRQQQQLTSSSSSSNGCSSSSQEAAGRCTSDSDHVLQGGSSDTTLLAGQGLQAARVYVNEGAVDVSQELVGSTPPQHKYNLYQPRWAKQQQQQPQQQRDQPSSLSTYDNWQLGSSGCTAGKLGSNSTSSTGGSSSSKFCGPAGMSPEKDRVWVPSPRATVTVDLRRETTSLLCVQRPTATDTTATDVTAAAAGAAAGSTGFGFSSPPRSSSGAWDSNSSSASDSDSNSSEGDWKLFRQQVRRPAAQQQQQ